MKPFEKSFFQKTLLHELSYTFYFKETAFLMKSIIYNSLTLWSPPTSTVSLANSNIILEPNSFTWPCETCWACTRQEYAWYMSSNTTMLWLDKLRPRVTSSPHYTKQLAYNLTYKLKKKNLPACLSS